MRTAVLGTRRDEFLVLGPRGTTSWFSTYSTDCPNFITAAAWMLIDACLGLRGHNIFPGPG